MDYRLIMKLRNKEINTRICGFYFCFKSQLKTGSHTISIW